MNWRYISTLYLVWTALFLDWLLYTVLLPVIPTYLKKLHVSQTAIGVLFASKGVSQMMSGPFWGWMVDIFGPRRPLLLSTVILSLSTVAFALGTNYWFLLGARAVEGFASGSAFSAGMAYISLVFEYVHFIKFDRIIHQDWDEAERSEVMGWAQTGLATGLILGPPFGGILYGLSGKKELPFFVVAGLCGLYAFSQLLIPNYAPAAEDVKSKTKEGEEAQKEPYQGVIRLLKDPQVLLILGVFFLSATIMASMDPVFPIWFEKKFHVTATATGLAFLVSTSAYAISNPIVVYLGRRIRRPILMSLGALFLGCFLPASALMPTIWATLMCMFVFGISVAFIDSSAFPYLSQLVETRHSARYFGAMYSISDIAGSLGSVIGPIVGSILYDRFNYFIALYSFGVIAMLYSPLVVIFAARPPPPVALMDVSVN